MAYPRVKRERIPDGVFIRCATVQDVNEIKSQVNDVKSHLASQDSQPDRLDSQLNRHDARIEDVVAEFAELKTRQAVPDNKLDVIVERQSPQDVNINALSDEMSEMKVRMGIMEVRMDGMQDGMRVMQDAMRVMDEKIDKHHAHMYRLLYALIGAGVAFGGLLVKIAFF